MGFNSESRGPKQRIRPQSRGLRALFGRLANSRQAVPSLHRKIDLQQPASVR